ncbi:MAG: hypothetical protein B7X74_04965, partial [Thiotrichales bacterium 39-47-5]
MRYWLLLSILLTTFSQALWADVTRATPLLPSIQGQQLVVDGQVTLGMTPTMEKALLHGIAVEYSIQVT